MTEYPVAQNCFLRGISHVLPNNLVDNSAVFSSKPGVDVTRLTAKTGVARRHICGGMDTASSLGTAAATRVLSEFGIAEEDVDTLIVGSQSPDFTLPGNSHILHANLGLRKRCAAFDVTLGCSGFTYGMWLARSLILSGSSRCVLLVSVDTYSRFCDDRDVATSCLFGDGAGAAVFSASSDNAIAEIGHSVLFSDGSGVSSLLVREGAGSSLQQQANSGSFARPVLYMNGPEVFNFALREVKPAVDELLLECGLSMADIDLFLLHQANAFMLEHLRKKLGVSEDRLPVDVSETGNTVNASIPVLISRMRARGLLRGGQRSVVVGFGVGLSWAATLVNWK